MCVAFGLSLTSLNTDGGRNYSSYSWKVVKPLTATSLQNSLTSQATKSVSISPADLTKAVAYQIEADFVNYIGATGSCTFSFTPTGCVAVAAQLSTDLTQLLLSFTIDDFTLLNATLDTASAASTDLCSYVFDSTTLALLGTAPQCL